MTHTDATGQSSTLSAYDRLNRPHTRAYMDGASPVSVTYAYDQDTVGTLSSVTATDNGAAYTTSYTHDKFGRVTGSTQSTGGNSYPFTYAYNLSDQLTGMGYPSGRQVTYTLDAADQVTGVSGVKGGQPTTYASGVTYTPAGDLSSLPLGNGTTESHTWNDLFQPLSITAGNQLALNFYPCANGQTSCTLGNTGNVLRENIGIGGATVASREYRYDTLNRLTMAEEKTAAGFTPVCPDTGSVWRQGYQYDAAGNRTIASQSNLGSSTWNVTGINSTTNRITDSGWGYDAAGNITQDWAGEKLAFDGEGRLSSWIEPM